jgi:hypothetical protein
MRLQGFNISPLDINLLDYSFDSSGLDLIRFKGSDSRRCDKDGDHNGGDRFVRKIESWSRY